MGGCAGDRMEQHPHLQLTSSAQGGRDSQGQTVPMLWQCPKADSEQPAPDGLSCAKPLGKLDLPYLSTRGQRWQRSRRTPAAAAPAGAALSPTR